MSFEFQCRVCRAGIEDDHVDLDTGRVLCRSCGTISRSAVPAGRPVPRDPPPLPARVRIREGGGRLFIAVRWFDPGWIPLIAGVALADLFLVVVYRELAGFGVHWTAYVFGSVVPLTVALLGTYPALAVLLNRTHIQVEAGSIRAVHLPLPCYLFKRIRAADIEQIFSRADAGTRFHVCVLRRDGRWFRLVRNLRSDAQALFIERAIERHLGLEDRPVLGELKR